MNDEPSEGWSTAPESPADLIPIPKDKLRILRDVAYLAYNNRDLLPADALPDDRDWIEALATANWHLGGPT